MYTHLFLTGDKHIGKTTAIQRFLSSSEFCIGGFQTVRTNNVYEGQYSVHMIPAGSHEALSGDNLLFMCGNRFSPEIAGSFNRLGAQILCSETTKKADLILMDELGPAEMAAGSFQKLVWNTLNGHVPVLGVLQKSDAAFTEKIRQLRRTYRLEVTTENRDLIPERIASWYCQEWLSDPDRRELRDSFGGIIFDKNETDTAVLMIGSLKGWSFPKGHGYEDETPVETAEREIFEETGIRARIDGRFSRTVSSIKKGDDRSVTFFSGISLDGRKLPVPIEIPGAAWVPIDKAASLIVFESDRQVYLEALKEYRK